MKIVLAALVNDAQVAISGRALVGYDYTFAVGADSGQGAECDVPLRRS